MKPDRLYGIDLEIEYWDDGGGSIICEWGRFGTDRARSESRTVNNTGTGSWKIWTIPIDNFGINDTLREDGFHFRILTTQSVAFKRIEVINIIVDPFEPTPTGPGRSVIFAENETINYGIEVEATSGVVKDYFVDGRFGWMLPGGMETIYGNLYDTDDYIDAAVPNEVTVYIDYYAPTDVKNGDCWLYYSTADDVEYIELPNDKYRFEAGKWATLEIELDDASFAKKVGGGKYGFSIDTCSGQLVIGKITIIKKDDISFAELNIADIGSRSVTVDLSRPYAGNPVLIVTVYNGKGKLLAMKTQAIEKSGEVTVNEITVPTAEGTVIKAMM